MASPRGAAIEAKGSHLGPFTWFFIGRAIIRRGLAVVWPEEGPSMTRARALKQLVRDRAARTGERYTTARRHVLAGLAAPKAARPLAATASTGPMPVAKGAMSDARILEKTGHDLAYWFGVLDRFGAVEKGHTAAARHLYADLKVPGWYAQSITVSYERARGVRAVNQRVDGTYEMSASKSIDATSADIVRIITSRRLRRAWLIDVDAELAKALTAALDSKTSKGFSVRADGLATFRYNWGSTKVQWYIMPTKTGKMAVVVANGKLAGAEMLEQRRKLWRTALTALAAQFDD